MKFKNNIYVILYPGCISYEVALAAELLSKNYNIINISPDGSDITECSGLPLRTINKYSDFLPENCKAILVPGGDPQSIIDNIEIDQILRVANENKIIIGAICAGPSILAKSGILVGRKIAHGYKLQQLQFLSSIFKGVELCDDQFAVDEHIITAKAEAHIDFAVEIASRLDCVNPSHTSRLKEYYRGLLGRRIRPLALAILMNNENQFLFHQAFDSVKKEIFYRPLGGGIEFSEQGKTAIAREVKEELDLEVSVGNNIGSFESIFTYEGKVGHEIILLFETKFIDPLNYSKQEFDIVETGKVISKAVWRSLEQIKSEGAKLYPVGIDSVLKSISRF